jgi:tRNA threonylcarbamoyl adenosine modification protein YeaZ
MRLLAIETSGAACSVAAWDEDLPAAARLRGHRRIELGRGHAEALLPMVIEALDLAGWRFADLDALAVNRGPGGFTGVRVGVAAARALALAAALPVVGVTGLETLASLAAASGLAAPGATVLAALDARRGQVYAQAFATDLVPLTGARALAPAEAAALGVRRPLILVGDGAALVRAELAADEADSVIVHDATLDAAAVAARAANRLAAGETPGAGFDLAPLYLRPPDARPQAPVVVSPRTGAALSVGGA